ncbi:helix-turn-helix domain-containing protein [Bradyrhizobium liaoningense]|uniref:helix-turn-helix domain-containing protein n=1 Tax=Bradyrhizobium liaoningense TaxID=43992 RepID=UPI0004BBCF09|nr:helix-turn-helix transcriptional regulator [Bradyrhizobium liaoningense]
MSRDVAIGKYLAALREQANLKQGELAKKLEWSSAVLSRVESGERPLSEDELDIILGGINTPDARRLKAILSRQWSQLPEPPLGDSDSDLLWEAEQTAQKIHALAEQPDVKQVFERRLVRYEEELSVAAERVLNKRYRAAFVGTIAVGKSTSICRVEGLELPSSKGMPSAVLETGGGGITICDVHVRRGPGYGLIIEPCTEDEIRQHVMDFANSLLAPPAAAQTDDDESNAGAPGISREVDRALRSMTGLRRRRAEKKPDGSIFPALDQARLLAEAFPDAKALTVEVLSRMELHKRDRRDIWHSDAASEPALEWLQETFEKVNNGRHPEFTVPKRIEIVVPTTILRDDSVSVTLVDTRGIDDLAARADLEQHFDDSHTVVLLCSLFPQAPATQVRQLLTRAKEGGVRTLETHSAIVALARAGEALAVKFEGQPAETSEEGYELKAEEIQLKLHPLGLTNLPVAFFNAAEDPPEQLRTFILARINVVRESHRAALREIIEGAKNLLANYAEEQSRETLLAAARRLALWLDENADLSSAGMRNVHESLISATSAAHWKTIYATVARKGAWPNLDYAHQLSHGARRIATQVLEPKLLGFQTIAQSVLIDDELTEAHGLVRQAMRLLEDAFDNIVRTVQLVGESIHTDELREDTNFWQESSADRGTGYKDRFTGRNRQWFEVRHRGEGETRVMKVVEQKWQESVGALRDLLPQADGATRQRKTA